MVKAPKKKSKTSTLYPLPSKHKSKSKILKTLDELDLLSSFSVTNSDASKETDSNNETSSSKEESQEINAEDNDNIIIVEKDTSIPLATPPSTGQKRKHRKCKSNYSQTILTSNRLVALEVPQAQPEKTITFILSILSAPEAKKQVSKHNTKTQSLQLSTDKPWDTLKAQILVKLDSALAPSILDYENYDVMFYIPRVLPKPGLSLVNQLDYTMLNTRARNMSAKDPTINLHIVKKVSEHVSNKENEIEIKIDKEKEQSSKGSKKVHIATFCI